jgi:hypothetical protein
MILPTKKLLTRRRAMLIASVALAAPAIIIPGRARAARIDLTADTTFYVSMGGNDLTGDGLSPTTAWQTIQHAYDTVSNGYDTRGFNVKFQFADGGPYAPLSTVKPLVGQGSAPECIFQGNPDPALWRNVAVNGGGVAAFILGPGGGGRPQCRIQGIWIQSQVNGVECWGAGTMAVMENCGYDTGAANIQAAHGAEAAEQGTNHVIHQGQWPLAHVIAQTSGRFTSDGATIEYLGNPTFTLANYYCVNLGQMNLAGMTFVNKSTVGGMRFYVSNNGVISAVGAGGDINYLPGSIAGIVQTSTGGIYA